MNREHVKKAILVQSLAMEAARLVMADKGGEARAFLNKARMHAEGLLKDLNDEVNGTAELYWCRMCGHQQVQVHGDYCYPCSITHEEGIDALQEVSF